MLRTSMLPYNAMASSYDEEKHLQIDLDQKMELATAVNKTARAAMVGIAISAIDGPLPVMDAVGFGVAVTMATLAWVDYFFIDD